MIYLDASVALAELFTEDRRPPEDLWSEHLVSSRLLKYEVINRLHAHRLPQSYAAIAAELLDRIEFVDLSRETLMRALDPFPPSVRTLDGLHLATLLCLRSKGHGLVLASYNKRMLAAATALGVGAHEF